MLIQMLQQAAPLAVTHPRARPAAPGCGRVDCVLHLFPQPRRKRGCRCKHASQVPGYAFLLPLFSAQRCDRHARTHARTHTHASCFCDIPSSFSRCHTHALCVRVHSPLCAPIGCVELADVSTKLPRLRRSPGMSTWTIMVRHKQHSRLLPPPPPPPPPLPPPSPPLLPGLPQSEKSKAGLRMLHVLSVLNLRSLHLASAHLRSMLPIVFHFTFCLGRIATSAFSRPLTSAATRQRFAWKSTKANTPWAYIPVLSASHRHRQMYTSTRCRFPKLAG